MTDMQVRKRNGTMEAVKLDKIVRAITKSAEGLEAVVPMLVATKTVAGLYNGVSTKEIEDLAIQVASSMTVDDPQYANLAAVLLSNKVDKDVEGQGIASFAQSIQAMHREGLLGDRVFQQVEGNRRKYNAMIVSSRTRLFEYFGLKTLADRYLLRHPTGRAVLETPQYFFLRIAIALTDSTEEAKRLYDAMSNLDYLPSSPTLFNAGCKREQLSSCFLLDSPQDDLEAIYKSYADVAKLSKFSGGIGTSFTRVRSRGSLIRGTNGHSNGIVSWLRILNASVKSVNQGGKRPGACAVYLEPWHGDIEEFLELRDNTGDPEARTYNLNLANWIPDLFMRRVESGGSWSLFNPADVPDFPDLYGEDFDKAYEAAEAKGLATKKIQARDLYGRMVKTLAETGNGWMNFKDRCNKTSNQTAKKGNVIHSSNLCTEILEVNREGEVSVCNLASINLCRHTKVDAGKVSFDFDKLGLTVRAMVRQLDQVIDVNFYTIPETAVSNIKWRPVGLGLMGLQDVFFQMMLAFDSEEAKTLSRKISEHIYFHALTESCKLAQEKGKHPSFEDTHAAKGNLQFDLQGVTPSDSLPWHALKEEIKAHGLRNSLLIAIAPTATIASIAGCYECIEPQVSNLFKRETLSGDFLQVNKYLVRLLKNRDLWTSSTRDAIKMTEGSVQPMEALTPEERKVFRTVWEIPQRSLIDMAAERSPFIDQSQSMNLFLESPNIGQVSSMYMHAWKSGLKTSYYLRSRPATRITKTTIQAPVMTKTFTEEEALACSLENPELCEACQ